MQPTETAHWRSAVDLIENGLVPINSIRAFGADGKLSEKFIALFELSPIEAQQLQGRLDSALSDLQKLELSAATITKTDTGVTIAIPPFPDAGASVYEQLNSDILSQLGPERGAAFSAIAGDQLEQRFARFGAIERKIQISRGPDAGGSYSVVEASETGPGQHHEQRRTVASAEEALAALGPVGESARSLVVESH